MTELLAPLIANSNSNAHATRRFLAAASGVWRKTRDHNGIAQRFVPLPGFLSCLHLARVYLSAGQLYMGPIQNGGEVGIKMVHQEVLPAGDVCVRRLLQT